jgi:hypothetical protein
MAMGYIVASLWQWAISWYHYGNGLYRGINMAMGYITIFPWQRVNDIAMAMGSNDVKTAADPDDVTMPTLTFSSSGFLYSSW